jgi:dinuclear metal center YbgI/SA1388 family protein
VPVPLKDIISDLDELLQPARFQDYCVNGLQVPGASEVATIATGVSASAELFELAASLPAQLLLVHHGLFWNSGVTAVDAALKRRLQLLFDANMSLAAYHLPLDAHPEVGNNALLASALGAGALTPFAEVKGAPIGFLARLPGDGIAAGELFARVRAATGQEPLIFDAGAATVRTVAIVSGAGADYIPDAAAAGAQALLTGEASERTMALAREHQMHLIAAGHYATETLGVRRLGEHLAERFGIAHTFLDVPNPV